MIAVSIIKKYFSYLLPIIFIWALFPSLAKSQVSVSADLDSTNMMIGDQVYLHLNIQYPKGISITNVDLKALEDAEAIEIYNSGKLDTLKTGNINLLKQDIAFSILDSGSFQIPKIAVTYNANGRIATAYTNDLPMEVSTPNLNVPVNSGVLPAPIKPIMEESLSLYDFIPFLLGLIVLGLIGGLIYYLLKRKRKVVEVEAEPEVIIPAHELALSKIRDLKSKELWQKGEIKAYQTELTYIIREYLENRYGILALESTTTEIQQQLKGLDFDQSMKGELTNMLQMADLVKFAKATPPVDMHSKIMEEAERFINKTKKILVVNDESSATPTVE